MFGLPLMPGLGMVGIALQSEDMKQVPGVRSPAALMDIVLFIMTITGDA